jgi:hypothetical protein
VTRQVESADGGQCVRAARTGDRSQRIGAHRQMVLSATTGRFCWTVFHVPHRFKIKARKATKTVFGHKEHQGFGFVFFVAAAGNKFD